MNEKKISDVTSILVTLYAVAPEHHYIAICAKASNIINNSISAIFNLWNICIFCELSFHVSNIHSTCIKYYIYLFFASHFIYYYYFMKKAYVYVWVWVQCSKISIFCIMSNFLVSRVETLSTSKACMYCILFNSLYMYESESE